MQMEMEIKDDLTLALERLSTAATILEQAADRVTGVDLQASLERVTLREQHLEQRLAEAEATIETLRAEAGKTAGRKTAPTAAHTFMAREGVAVEPGALDAALRSLSLEQRIAVKSEMMRAGLL